jgi:murein DD-endopeptidase MepM/ murein hydrolase activator NlpD
MKALTSRTALLLLVVFAPGPAPAPAPAPAAIPAAIPAAASASAAPGPPAVPAASSAAAAGWSWPLSPRPAVLRRFDPPERPWLSGHRGVDLQAAYDGAPVTAPAAGRVSFAGFVVDRPVLTLDHGNGLRSTFEPLESTLQPGAAVLEGAVLGRTMPGHCGGTPCLHWGVRRGEEYLNPLGFVIDLRPSILLPPVRPGPAQGGFG